MNAYSTAMEMYQNISGLSGVVAYQIEEDSITVEFSDGRIYLYTYASTGKKHVEKMKQLATRGWGLCTYITLHVRQKYSRQLS